MATVTVTLPSSARNRRSWRSFVKFIGQQGKGSNFEQANGQLILFEGDQATIDAQLVAYTADQTNIDNDLDTFDQAADVAKDILRFQDDVVINAVVEVYRVELNILRAAAGLPDRSEGFIDGQITAKIANP